MFNDEYSDENLNIPYYFLNNFNACLNVVNVVYDVTGRFLAKRSDAEQRRWNILYPHQRTGTLDGRFTLGISLQVASARRQQKQGE